MMADLPDSRIHDVDKPGSHGDGALADAGHGNPCVPDRKGLFNIFFPKPKEDMPAQELCEIFGKFGDVADLDKTEHRIFIRYYKKEHAERAKDELGAKYDIHFPQSTKLSFRSNPTDMIIKPEVFVGNLHEEVKEEDLRKIVEPFSVVQLTLKNGPGQGYAFLVFTTVDDALSVVRQISGRDLLGKQLFARFNWQSGRHRSRSRSRGRTGGYGVRRRSRSASPPGVNFARKAALSALTAKGEVELFVCGFPISTPDADLKKLFSEFGFIEVRRLQDRPRYPETGGAVVLVKDIEFAGKAIKRLNGYDYMGYTIKVRLTEGQVVSQYVPSTAYMGQDRGRPRYRDLPHNMDKGRVQQGSARGQPAVAHSGHSDVYVSPRQSVRPGVSQIETADHLVNQLSSMMSELLDNCPNCVQINNKMEELKTVIHDMGKPSKPQTP